MKIKFVPQDMWIGLYVKRQETASRRVAYGNFGLITERTIIRTWYLCLLPCLPIIWETRQLEYL